jgi:protein-histidine pros-kinase
MSLLVKFNFVLLLVLAVGLVPASFVTYGLLQRNARSQVEQNARLMMETAMATRTYTIQQIKPLLDAQLAERFLPQTVPAYSATEVFNNLRKNHPEYTYKEATLNPTNPRDRTVEWEADVVTEFRNDPKRAEIVGERDTPQGRTLFLSKPIQIKDAKCLACHDTPALAPGTVVAAYGPSNGFGWKLNEVIGAQIVQVPMAVPLTMARQAFTALVGSILVIFVGTLVVLNLLLKFVVIRPLEKLSRMADQVSLGNMDVPEVDVGGRDEVAQLAGSFNRMKISLKKALAMLDAE